jgi:predicted nicotinamide N-methyase
LQSDRKAVRLKAIMNARADPQRRGRFDLRRFIQANLPIRPAPGVPEIRLHQAEPASGLWRLARRDARGFGSPYWAYPWAGGLALARYLLDRPTSVAGLRVLDLGSGCGIVGIAAAKAGASEVIAADIDPYALAALELNAVANAVTVSTRPVDLAAGAPPSVDLIAVGDLFYAADLAERVTAFLDRCLAAGTSVMIGDPGRAFLPRSRLRLLAEFAVSDVGESRDTAKMGLVFAFARDEE